VNSGSISNTLDACVSLVINSSAKTHFNTFSTAEYPISPVTSNTAKDYRKLLKHPSPFGILNNIDHFGPLGLSELYLQFLFLWA
jgi:hypothetical protein